jgi:1,4-alpha-glucan branching enzyme
MADVFQHIRMGGIPIDGGVAFRVWAPNAQSVAVVGSFNGWDAGRAPMTAEANGSWYGEVAGAQVGDEYKFHLTTPDGDFLRIDPYARAVTGSVGNAVVHESGFNWEGDDFQNAPINQLVVYELHVGTFNDDGGDGGGQFSGVTALLGHLQRLGINAIQIMPVAEVAGDRSWGYNPAHIFSVEVSYGGPVELKRFIKRAHQHGIAVFLDVVYNHLGPNDLDLWRFDGWSEDGGGGIYFYNDARAVTPWGSTRPDYGRPQVRQFIRDNIFMWLEEYHVDGLRFDCTQFIRTVNGSQDTELPEGWSLLQRLSQEIAEALPGRITIAEDLQSEASLTVDVAAGGAGFDAQWDSAFVHPIRAAVIASDDSQRSLAAIRDALCNVAGDAAFARVIYSESHDEVANGKARVPQEIDPQDPQGWLAQKRSTLAAAMVFTAPGIPMLFQGQEFLEGACFHDTVPLDWDQNLEFRGIVRLYRDLIALRLNKQGMTRGLTGEHINVHHMNEANNMLAMHRWHDGGPGDDVLVVANFLGAAQDGYVLGFPAPGMWRLRFNSDWQGYSEAFAGHPSDDVEAEPGEYDGMPCHGAVSLAGYSVLIYSQ